MAKGSGMIHPNMATMLGYLTCDAGVPANVWQATVKQAVDRSVNVITVDGDTSTNDTYLAFAAGEPLSSEHFEALETGLTGVSQHLAKGSPHHLRLLAGEVRSARPRPQLVPHRGRRLTPRLRSVCSFRLHARSRM